MAKTALCQGGDPAISWLVALKIIILFKEQGPDQGPEGVKDFLMTQSKPTPIWPQCTGSSCKSLVQGMYEAKSHVDMIPASHYN